MSSLSAFCLAMGGGGGGSALKRRGSVVLVKFSMEQSERSLSGL
jgi:hypothetical protein